MVFLYKQIVSQDLSLIFMPSQLWMYPIFKTASISYFPNLMHKTNAWSRFLLGYWSQARNKIQHTWMPPLYRHSEKTKLCAFCVILHDKWMIISHLIYYHQTTSFFHKLLPQGIFGYSSSQ